jgi:hypothetical protein
METHVFLTNQAVRSLDGLTAFSALPDAPVLPYKPRRRSVLAGLGNWRVSRNRAARRLAPATTARNACA